MFTLIFVLIQPNVKKKSKPDRKERPPQIYQLSRYVPFVKDLMEVRDVLKTGLKMFFWKMFIN